jgi:HAD superfamily hydrolase (TIGR01662 family)
VRPSRIAAVLLDCDGTLVEDVPYNGDPDAVSPMPGAREALDRLRAAGLAVGVVSNQSGIARGYLTDEQAAAVRDRIAKRLGPFGSWRVCPHDPDRGCGCRKPRPGLVLAAAADLGVDPDACVVIGDIGSDVGAAQAAGARSVLIPTAQTRQAEVAAAPLVRPSLSAAVDWILAQQAQSGRAVLAVRADSAGDVLVTGPAIRAIAAGAWRLTLLHGPRGKAAAALLPGPSELLEWTVPWIDPDPPAVTGDDVLTIVKQVRSGEFDDAVIFTSYHQSPLPTALMLRMAGVARISAISDDYPGALLDVRHRFEGDHPETHRALSLARAAGYDLPDGDDGRLRVRHPLPDVASIAGPAPYVVVHPGTSVPARACPPSTLRRAVQALVAAGRRVLVTGSAPEAALTAFVAGSAGVDLGGRTSLATLAAVLDGAACVVVGNTGPAHLAAAVGTPVVSLFAPTVPWRRWRPYGVPTVRLGDQHAPCALTRATVCPVPDHPCLSDVDVDDVVAAVEELACGS